MESGDEPRLGRGHNIPIGGWKIRFDSPPVHGLSQRAERGDILGLFRAWDGVSGADRRGEVRYEPVETQAWVGWWKGSRFLISRAELVNLSRGGALVGTKTRPPTSQPIWICLGAPHPVDYVQARVLDTMLRPAGDFRARLEFRAPCPPSFLLAAGQAVDDAPRLPSPSETDFA